jgi:hypothetical protein
MAKIETSNPAGREIQSQLIAGITSALNMISGLLEMGYEQCVDVEMTAIAIDNTSANYNRIWACDMDKKLWLKSPEPVIKINGTRYTESSSIFTIDYIGGSITFNMASKPEDGTVITASFTHIIGESEKIASAFLEANQTITGSGIPSTTTIGAVGSRYIDILSGDEYICISANDNAYVWELNVKSVNGILPSSGGNITLSAEDVDAYAKSETDAKIDAITANSLDVYTKTEIDNKVASITARDVNAYSKSETDGKIASITAEDVGAYTKSETDNKVASVTASTLGVYTKTQTDSAISSALTSYSTKNDLSTAMSTVVKSINSTKPDSSGNVAISIPTIYSGSTVPDSSLGNVGDLYVVI